MKTDPNDDLDALNFNSDAMLGVADVGMIDASADYGPDSSLLGFDLGSASVDRSTTGNDAVVDYRASNSSTSHSSTPTSLTVADGGVADISGPGTNSVIFAGSSGKLVLDSSIKFTGDVTGLSGSDTIDLADIAFNGATRATFLGTASGGTLTVSDGTETAKLELTGDYLSSTWSISSDGKGGTNVVDPVVSTNWQMMMVGAGGFADGLDEAPDGTLVVRTDTNGAYLWNGTTWQQLVTASSMPAAFLAANPVSSGEGVYEIQVAASNSNVMYMMFDGDVFVSANKGTTWTQTSFANVTESPNDNFRWYGQKMAIDPNNSNIVYVGTPQNGLWVTTNGGTTWSKVSAVPVSGTSGGDYPGITGIMFDPGIGGSVAGVTQTIFASSYGNGVYESLNGGSTWTHLSGGPSNVEFATVGSNGAYYAVGNSGQSLWRYYEGAWTDLLSSFGGGQIIQAVAINKTNPSEIVAVASSGYLNVSYDGGSTWSGIDWSQTLTSTDIPWEAGANTESGGSIWLSVGGAAFSTTNPNELILSTGTGSFDVTVPTTSLTGTLNYKDMSAGIENLVANEVLVAPGGDPILASWDRPFIQITNLDAYPTTYGPINADNIVAGWSVDYASSTPTFLVGLADWWGVEESGYSTNGGQTWTAFATDIPGASTSFIGGSIAASTTQNFIWAPADGNQPYYTLNGGETWKPITLPGVTSWSGFDFGYYLTGRTVTADRVLTNTFYLYDNGVFETTNGGVSWTEVYTGAIAPYAYNTEIMAVPGESGNLFWTAGIQGNGTNPPSYAGFYFSSNQGKTWTALANVLDVIAFGFGAAATAGGYPSVYIVGYVNEVYGIWQSTNKGLSWTQIGTQPAGELNQITTISGDPDKFGAVYVGFSGGGYAYLSANDPTVTGVAATPSSGVETAGDKITFTVSMSETVTVSGGAPTLNLNDGGVATYLSGSGSAALVFSYTVSASDSDVTELAISSVSLNGATVEDSSGNSADLTGAIATFPALAVNPPADITALTETPASGDLGVGKAVTFTLKVSEIVTVAGGTPTLTLNDGGVATYTGGSGTNTLTFSYTVATGQSTASLAATVLALNGATILNGAGTAAALSLTGLTQVGPQVDTLTPAVTTITESPASGDIAVGKTVTFTLKLSDVVTVTGGTPTLTLNDGGVASYTGGSGTNTLTFSYTVATGQSTASLAATVLALNGATIVNGAGMAAVLSLTGLTQVGPQVDTLTPAVTTITESPASGTVSIGGAVTFTLKLSDVVTVAGGTPTLTLNDGGVASYTGGSGTNTLTFSYTVATGQSTASLAATVLALNGATILNGAGTAAALSLTGLTQVGPQVDTLTPAVTTITESPASGDIAVGKTVTFTLKLSDVVTVTGGTPTLTLNDGGVASYTGGSGTNTLTFSYTVATGQSTASLAATVLALNGATIVNGAGMAAVLSLTGLTQVGPQVDTLTPAVTTITESPASGTVSIGGAVTFTLKLSDVVTVAGGTPTLTLNDGGVASYTGGSGTNTLTFSYTVATGQSTASLAATVLALNGATILNGAGTAAALSLTGLTQVGPQVDTLTPAVTTITESPASGDIAVGKTVTFTLKLSDVVTVAGGTPTLTLNDGGVASYTGGSGTNTLTFSYTVATGQSTASLAATVLALNGATIVNGAGTAASLSLAGVLQSGPAVGQIGASVTSIYETPSSGNLGTGSTMKFVVHLSSAVVVSGGVPTLTLNSGGVATYTGGSGTTALTFSYTVGTGQSAASLAATSLNLNGASIGSVGGAAANLSISGIKQTGSEIWNGLWLAGGSLTSSNATIYLASGVYETLVGSNDRVNATSTGNSLTIGGNGIRGVTDIFNGSSASIYLQTNSSLCVVGADVGIRVASNSDITINGNNNWIGAGSSDGIWLNGGIGEVVQASDDTLYILADVGALILGAADVITAASGDTLTIGSGAGDLIGASSANLIFSSGVSATLTGADDTIDAGSSDDTLTIGGNGATGSVDAVTAWYDTLTLEANSNVSVSGGHNTLSVGANSDVTMTGGFDTITVAAGDSLSLSGETSSTIEVQSLGGGTVTISSFNSSNADVIDLLGGVGGYTSAAAVLKALTSDGDGGSHLSLGVGGTLDIAGLAPSALLAANFKIG